MFLSTFPDPPSAPQNLCITDINKNLFSLSWDKPKSDGGSPVTGYVVELRTPPSVDYKPVGKVEADTMTYTVEGLKEDCRYYVRVGAENPAGVSESYAEMRQAVVTKLKEGNESSALFVVKPLGSKKRFLHAYRSSCSFQ